MLGNIKKFFEERLMPTDGESESETASTSIEYACATLLIELAKADFDDNETERQHIYDLLEKTFAIRGEQLDDLVALAETASADASDLFQFTSLINEHYSNPQKIMLMEKLWIVAYADGRLDKYEEQFIRRVAGLINLPPSEVPKTKMRVKQILS